MARRVVRSRWLRWTRRLVGVTAVMLLLPASFAAYLVGTTGGGRLALSLAERFLPEQAEVEVGRFSGRLVDRFELSAVRLRMANLEATVDRVSLEWRAAGLLRKRIHARALTVDGLDVRLLGSTADSISADAARPDTTVRRPIPDLPVAVSFDSVSITGVTVHKRDSVWVSGGRAQVSGTLDDYRLAFEGTVDVPDLGSAGVTLRGGGSTTDFRIDELDALTLGGTVSAAGRLGWWPATTWDLQVRGDTLHPSTLMPDSTEWPGVVSFTASSSGTATPGGELDLAAVVDTVFGQVRGERLAGRFEGRLSGGDLQIPAARIAWGPGGGTASGKIGADLDLEFDVRVPDLDLILPGSSGRVGVRGRATGPRDTPRVRASFEADEVTLESARIGEARGEVDLDLAGPLSGSVRALDLVIAGRELDSASVSITGRRPSHRIEASIQGPDGSLELTASGGLDATDAWSGTVASLRFAADTIGSWSLTDPVDVFLAKGILRLGRACLESPPSRVCVEGESDPTRTRVTALVDSLQVERLSPLLPEGLHARTVVGAEFEMERRTAGDLEGRIAVSTSAGSLSRSVRGEDRTLFFEPIELAGSSGPEGLEGTIALHMTDSTGVRLFDVLGRVDSPVAIRALRDFSGVRGQPVSAHLEIEADDLLLLTDGVLPQWDVSGSFRAGLDLEVDPDGRLKGHLCRRYRQHGHAQHGARPGLDPGRGPRATGGRYRAGRPER